MHPVAMSPPSKSAETWQALMELRCRREVIERWLASRVLPDDQQQSLRGMLREIEDQLQVLSRTLSNS